jgi:putative zinc finger/helix-turn-helix YgiT family protein
MTCFQCGRQHFEPANVKLEGTRSGETFWVETAGYHCSDCGFQTIDSTQSSEFTQRISDAYRSAHGMLTGPELRSLRHSLGMSQQEFSDYVGVGVASIKRWESGQVQEKAMDELIRLKTSLESARRNLRTVETTVPERIVVASALDIEFSAILAQSFGRGSSMRMDVSALLSQDCGEVRLSLAA